MKQYSMRKFALRCMACMLTLALAVTLAGCGGKAPSTPAATDSGAAGASGTTSTAEPAGAVDLSGYDFSNVKIGVLRSDPNSDEARSWEKYYTDMAAEFGFTVDFSTTEDAASEMSAINTYASKGYNGIISCSSFDKVSQVEASAAAKMYLVDPTSHPVMDDYDIIKDNEYYCGSTGPDNDTEFDAGYNMAQYYIEKGMTQFAMFGGAIAFANDMHIYRAAGMLVALCEADSSTNYCGLTKKEEIVEKLRKDCKVYISGEGEEAFTSDKFKLLGYVGGFSFDDDAYLTSLNNMFNVDGLECVLCVGAGDTMAGMAAGNAADKKFEIGAVDAITPAYAECFAMGKYSYDCGKFISMVGPSLDLLLNAIAGNRIVNDEGFAPRLSQGYWVAKSADEVMELCKVDNAEDGYIYNANVLRHFLGATYKDFADFTTNNTFDEAVAVNEAYGA